MIETSELEPIKAAHVAFSPDSIVVVDDRGRVLGLNPAAEAMFGYSLDEARGRTIAELIVPGPARAAHSRGFADYVAGGPPKVLGKRVETEALRKDGSLVPIELTVLEVKVEGGRFFTANIRDRSVHAARDEELEDTRRRLELAVKGAELGTWTFDLDTGAIWYSERSHEICGLPPGTVTDARTLKSVLHPDDWERVAAPYFRGFPNDSVEAEYRVVRPDGSIRWIYALGSADRDSEGKAHLVHGVHLDITDRKHAEEELEKTRRQLELAIEGAKLGSWTVDPRSGATWYSQRSRELHGVEEEGPLDARLLKRYIHPDDWERVIEPYRLDFPDDILALEHRVVLPSGEIRWLQSVGTAYRDEQGTVILVSGIHLDITDRKRAEEELKGSLDALHQAEKLSAMGSLLAGVSHELNNPLAAIVGQAEMLEEDSRGTALEERARKIKLAAERCARIVQTFLAMARQKEPRKTLVDVNDLVSAALEITEYALRTAGVSVRVTFGTRMPPVEGDRDQLHQVLVNLIVNAQQAMEGGEQFDRTLSIRTSVSHTGSILIDVADTGRGIPEAMRGRVFDPFFTTKPQGSGTGVGLSFSQGIVEAHRGTLTLEPSRRGACFRISLPPATETQLVAVAAETEAATSIAGGRALIVEDEPDVADTLRELLEREGYSVTTAGDGAAALMALDRDEFDLILSDLRMPGLGGADLYARLAETKPHVLARMGFVTGDTLGSSDLADFLKSSGRPVLEKPFTKMGVRCMIAAIAEAGPER